MQWTRRLVHGPFRWPWTTSGHCPRVSVLPYRTNLIIQGDVRFWRGSEGRSMAARRAPGRTERRHPGHRALPTAAVLNTSWTVTRVEPKVKELWALVYRLLGCWLLIAFSSAAADTSIRGVGPAGKVIKAHSGFTFTEGPAGDVDGNVYFTDIPASKIYKVTPDGTLTTFLRRSRRANGLMLDRSGRLIACQGGAGRVVAID